LKGGTLGSACRPMTGGNGPAGSDHVATDRQAPAPAHRPESQAHQPVPSAHTPAREPDLGRTLASGTWLALAGVGTPGMGCGRVIPVGPGSHTGVTSPRPLSWSGGVRWLCTTYSRGAKGTSPERPHHRRGAQAGARPVAAGPRWQPDGRAVRPSPDPVKARAHTKSGPGQGRREAVPDGPRHSESAWAA